MTNYKVLRYTRIYELTHKSQQVFSVVA